jgi:hypothetical protein
LDAPSLLLSTIIRSWLLRDLDQIVAVADVFYHSGDQIALFIEIALGTQLNHKAAPKDYADPGQRHHAVARL